MEVNMATAKKKSKVISGVDESDFGVWLEKNDPNFKKEYKRSKQEAKKKAAPQKTTTKKK
jgi:hypothetical protein